MNLLIYLINKSVRERKARHLINFILFLFSFAIGYLEHVLMEFFALNFEIYHTRISFHIVKYFFSNNNIKWNMFSLTQRGKSIQTS